MGTRFQINDPSLESQWRALILFGKNSATYKFAFAKSLIDLMDSQTTNISLTDLAVPFAGYIVEHLKENDKQGNSASNGYQKGKCFYSFQDISIGKHEDLDMCAVDHFLPYLHKKHHYNENANINGVWNLVLADKRVNGAKSARIPHRRYLDRLFNRNEFYIESKHPLAETIINQTGATRQQRISFLEKQYNLAKELAVHTWEPAIELNGSF